MEWCVRNTGDSVGQSLGAGGAAARREGSAAGRISEGCGRGSRQTQEALGATPTSTVQGMSSEITNLERAAEGNPSSLSCV